MDNNENKDLLLELYGSKTFCKIYQALEIDKIKFSFAKKNNPKQGIDCYMNADDFISDFIDIINSGELRKKMYAEKQRVEALKNQQGQNTKIYCDDIWECKPGIGSEKQLRKFSIQPGLSTELVFRAQQNEENITVGFAYRELKLLAYRWSFLQKDYEKRLAERYTIANMKNSYHSKQMQKQISEQEKEDKEIEANAPVQAEVSQNTSSPTASSSNSKPVYKVSSSFKDTSSNNAQQQQTQSSNATILQMTFKSTHALEDFSKGKCMKGITEEGDDYSIIFLSDFTSKIDPVTWNNFCQKAQNVGIMLTLNGAIKGNKFYVNSICA